MDGLTKMQITFVVRDEVPDAAAAASLINYFKTNLQVHDQTQQIIEGFVLMMFVTKRMMINDITISAHVSSVPNQME